jgi:hypothetical protein
MNCRQLYDRVAQRAALGSVKATSTQIARTWVLTPHGYVQKSVPAPAAAAPVVPAFTYCHW